MIDTHLMPNLPGLSAAKDKRKLAEVLEGDLLHAAAGQYQCQTMLKELMKVVVWLKAATPPWIRLNRIFRRAKRRCRRSRA